MFTNEGPIRWSNEQPSVVLFYGSLGDDPSTYLEHAVPLYDKRYVTLTESVQVSPFRRGAGTYVPPEGFVFITAGGTTGYMHRDGIQIGVDAGDEPSVLAASHSLTPMP